jgi:hypothetical protein
LPLEVTDVVGVRVLVDGLRVVVVGVRVVVVVRVLAVLGAVVVGVPEAGTSVSAGCAAESRFASWMSLLSAESAAALVLSDFEQAAARNANESASDALNRGIYCTISLLHLL